MITEIAVVIRTENLQNTSLECQHLHHPSRHDEDDDINIEICLILRVSTDDFKLYIYITSHSRSAVNCKVFGTPA
jgi:hypothetical protein